MRKLAPLAFVLAATAFRCPSPHPPPLVELDGECLLLYENASGVVGMDGSSSVPLDESHSLFVFGDTLLGTWSASGERLATGMLANSAAVLPNAEAGECFAGRSFLGGTQPRPVLRPRSDAPPDSRVWPTHPYVRDDLLALTFLYVTNEPGGGALGFRSWAHGIATGMLAGLSADADDATLLPGEEPQFAALLVHEGTAYAYRCGLGSDLGGGLYPCLLGSAPEAAITDPAAYRYFVAGAGFAGTLAEASFVVEGAPDFTVHWNERLGAFLMLFVEPFSQEIRVRTAPAPEGPFSEPTLLWPCNLPADDPQALCYGAKQHPQLGSPDGSTLVLTYNTISLDPEAQRLHPELYFPRLVTLELADLGL
jgi:hypothetical protein